MTGKSGTTDSLKPPSTMPCNLQFSSNISFGKKRAKNKEGHSELDFDQKDFQHQQHQLAKDFNNIKYDKDRFKADSDTMDDSPYEQERARPLLSTAEQFEKLRNLHKRLLQSPSKQTFSDILDEDMIGSHPGSEEFTRLFIDEVKETGDELAVAIGMQTIFEVIHHAEGITYLPTIFETMADRLQHLPAHRVEVVPHNGSQDGLYNSLYGLHVVSVAKQQMPDAADFLHIYAVAAPSDPFLPVYEDWIINSQAFKTRSDDDDMYVMAYTELARWLQTPQQYPHLLSRVMMMLELHCSQHNLLDRAHDVFFHNQREQATQQGAQLDEAATERQLYHMTSIILDPTIPDGGLGSSKRRGRVQKATSKRFVNNRQRVPSNFGGNGGIRAMTNTGSPANILPPRNVVRPRLSNFCGDSTSTSNFNLGSSSAPQLTRVATSNFGSASNASSTLAENMIVARPSNSVQHPNLRANEDGLQGQEQPGNGRSVRNPPRKATVRQEMEKGEYEDEEAKGLSDESMGEMEVDDPQDMDYHE